MALVPSQEYIDVWERKAGKIAVIEVLYKRRYFDTSISPSAFVYEDEFRTLSQSEFKDAGEIVNNLDTPFLNIFKTSAVTLRLNNADNQWIENVNSPSIFQADDIAPLGYDSFLTIFQIRFGYEKIDGTNEFVTLFTGVATNYNMDGNDAAVEVTVESNARLLQAADASKISDEFTQESTIPAVGDASNKDFFTTSTGVGRVSQVRVGGVSQTQGTDFTLTNLNVDGEGAKITFTSAPGNLVSIDASGIKWKAGLTIEELIELLCDEAGIGAGERLIGSVIFPGGLSGNKTIDSKTDWESGDLLQNVTTTFVEGDVSKQWFLVDDFADGDFTSNPVWTIQFLSNASAAVVSNVLITTAQAASGQIVMTTPQVKAFGTWEFIHEFGVVAGGDFQEFKITTDSSSVFGNGYGLSNKISTGEIKFGRWDVGVFTDLLGFSVGTHNNNYRWRITRANNGDFEVFRSPAGNPAGALSSLGTVTDNTHITSTHTQINCRNVGGSGTTQDLDTFHWSPEVNPPNAVSKLDTDYISEEFDILSVPTAWGNLDRTESLDGGAITYFTRTASISGGPFDAFVEIGASGQILSALNQFIQVKTEIRPDQTTRSLTTISKLVINFTTSTVNVALANFSGLTVKSAIEQLTRIADYEILFKGDGVFVFRSKTVSGDAVLAIDQENAISKLTNYTTGFKQIFNVGQVQYGEYFNEFDADDAGEVSPTSEERFGRLIKFEDYANFLLANDVNLGSSRARLIYENNFLPKRRCRLSCKIIPWLELSDILRISYYDNPLFRQSIFGDPLLKFGETGFGDPENILARDLDFKIVGIIFVPTGARCELILQEVLSS